jgi:hypothetical protein
VSGWTTDAILAAAAAWVWVPANGRQVLTDDYQLVTHPDRSHPCPVKVAWSHSQRPVSERGQGTYRAVLARRLEVARRSPCRSCGGPGSPSTARSVVTVSTFEVVGWPALTWLGLTWLGP